MNARTEHHSQDHVWRAPDEIRDLRRFYATPISPSDIPSDYVDGDPDYAAYAGLWSNIPGRPPTSWRVAVGGGLRVKVNATGGEGEPNSEILTIPSGFPLPIEGPERIWGTVGLTGEAVAVIDLHPDGVLEFIRAGLFA